MTLGAQNSLLGYATHFQKPSVLKTGFYGTEGKFCVKNRLLGYGMNCWDTGALRNYLAERTANDAEVTTCIPDYISICGLDLQSYQIYARCILLDTRTGYRSQYLAVSGILDL